MGDSISWEKDKNGTGKGCYRYSLGRQRVGRNPALRRAVDGGDSGSVSGILFTL